MSEIQESSVEGREPGNELILAPSERTEAPLPSPIMTWRRQPAKKPRQ